MHIEAKVETALAAATRGCDLERRTEGVRRQGLESPKLRKLPVALPVAGSISPPLANGISSGKIINVKTMPKQKSINFNITDKLNSRTVLYILLASSAKNSACVNKSCVVFKGPSPLTFCTHQELFNGDAGSQLEAYV
uniref:Uncharacterized protein n=1 Tax=Romanomermis culicivorax TaxID=13658 RepID=A0A915HZX1_ROMCU